MAIEFYQFFFSYIKYNLTLEISIPLKYSENLCVIWQTECLVNLIEYFYFE